ncbi:DUF1330 domain-containing protein [Aliikangiella sp. IMCC44359]|uniref:DUF1330 domain-containing protein n=1 Tax=Aliikangiella sp. IMCC44359 TaxID=3459125 RepID=UPI00403A9F94
MAYEILVGLNVVDDVGYQKYRDAMTPILHSLGGQFGYDLKISEVLKSEVEAKINRVFTIRFPSSAKKDEFFANPDYLSIREKFFNPSVSETTIISHYEK